MSGAKVDLRISKFLQGLHLDWSVKTILSHQKVFQKVSRKTSNCETPITVLRAEPTKRVSKVLFDHTNAALFLHGRAIDQVRLDSDTNGAFFFKVGVYIWPPTRSILCVLKIPFTKIRVHDSEHLDENSIAPSTRKIIVTRPSIHCFCERFEHMPKSATTLNF